MYKIEICPLALLTILLIKKDNLVRLKFVSQEVKLFVVDLLQLSPEPRGFSFILTLDVS